MARKCKAVGKTHFRLQDEANTQPRIMIANHAGRTSKEKVRLARELGNVTASGKDCQNILGTSNNPINEASNQQHIDAQGLTSRSAFNSDMHVQNMVQDQNHLMDEEYDQDSESESHDDEKKTRGPTFMKEIWGRPSTLPRIKIQCDDMGRPIGS